MRSSTRCKNKFYTNSWSISGEKLKLLENPRKCYTNKQISINSVPEEQQEQECAKNNKKINRVILQLNQRDYECANQVLNKQLKRIYETVKVEDFERILNNFYISSAYRQLPRRRNSDVLKTIDAEAIYEEFFGRFYNCPEDLTTDC